jgi:hypothetical protein
MGSQKTKVIAALFKEKGLGEVKSDDIVAAINADSECTLSTKNPANFLKDLIRSHSANDNWPEILKQLRVTAEQLYGGERVFCFRLYEPDQSEPFPNGVFDHARADRQIVTSLAIPKLRRQYPSKDENWVAGIVENLGLVSIQLAVQSPDTGITDLALVQVGKKTQPEIDMLYVADYDGSHHAVTCEIKQENERILEGQICGQVEQAFKLSPNFIAVKPMAIQVTADGNIYIVEFETILRAAKTELHIVSENVYVLNPPVPALKRNCSNK